ncbi:MAG: hypothetical protein AAB853_01250 [Patescibacteria group bacterium]
MSHENFSLPEAELKRRIGVLRQANATASQAVNEDAPSDVVETPAGIQSRSQLERKEAHMKIDQIFTDLFRSDSADNA